MWYPPQIGAVGTESVTLAQAQDQCNILPEETDFNAKLSLLISVAREHFEAYCGALLSPRDATVACDCFEDFCRLPLAPVASVTSISYVDTAGATQALAGTVYELRATNARGEASLEPSIGLKPGQSWPAIQAGSRITLACVAGYTTLPKPILHACLLFIAEAFGNRENKSSGAWTALDDMLCNYRRGA